MPINPMWPGQIAPGDSNVGSGPNNSSYLTRGNPGTESPQDSLFPLPAFIKKKGIGTEPMPFAFVVLWLR